MKNCSRTIICGHICDLGRRFAVQIRIVRLSSVVWNADNTPHSFDLRLDYTNGRGPGSVAHSHVGRDNTLYLRRSQRP